jgi:hypothetical protein
MNSAHQEMIEVIEETALFLKRLNWKWFKELEDLIRDGKELTAELKDEKFFEWYQKVKFCLEGEQQLGSLFVSSPLKREAFKELKLKWKQKLASLEVLK